MNKLFDEMKQQVREYCEKNGLDFEKVEHSPKCSGRSDIWIQHYDPQKGSKGLMDETARRIIYGY